MDRLRRALRRAARVPGCALALLACATSPPAIPRCPDLPDLFPETPLACRIEPEVEALREDIAALVEDAAGDVLVRIEFDMMGTVQSVCAEPGAADYEWVDRARIGERVDEIYALPPGPACLAGTRLDFNDLGAERAEIDAILYDCEREARARIIEKRRCFDRHQRERGEVWMFTPIGRLPLVFRAGEDPSSRRDAIRACSEPRAAGEGEPFDVLMGVARRGPRVVDCMKSYGWQLAF